MMSLRHQVPSADIWSLAAVLLQCLTGRPPYEGMRSMQMRRALLQGHAPGPIPEDVPTSLKRLLRQCFHETPDQRPSLSQIKQVCKQHGSVSCSCIHAEDSSGRYMASLEVVAFWTRYSCTWPTCCVTQPCESAVAAFFTLAFLVPMKTCCSAMMHSCIGLCICPCTLVCPAPPLPSPPLPSSPPPSSPLPSDAPHYIVHVWPGAAGVGSSAA